MQSGPPPAKVTRTDGDHGNAHSHSSLASLQQQPSTSRTGAGNAQPKPLTKEAKVGQLGGAGEEYQRLRAYWILFAGILACVKEQKGEQGRELWLNFEMADAVKFEDICVYYEKAWILIQSKLSNPESKENERKLTYGTMFGSDKTNPFMLLNYFIGFYAIEKKWKHGDIEKIIIFTNSELDIGKFEKDSKEEESMIEIGNEMHALHTFSKGKHYRLKGTEKQVDKMMELLEKAFQKESKNIIEALINLFDKNYKMAPILETYHMFLHEILFNDGEKVMFSKKEPKDKVVIEMYNDLKERFGNEFESKSIPSSKMENFWLQMNEKMEIRNIVKTFFEKLVLSVGQPNDTELRQEIIDKGIKLLRTWVRPDVLGRMNKTDLELPLTEIIEHFKKFEKNIKEPSDGKKENKRAHLKEEDFEKILEGIKNKTDETAQKLTQRPTVPYYIPRQFSYRGKNNFISESDFIKSLFTNEKNKQCYIVSAQPGMGKTSLMQNLAFELQKTHSDKAVFLIYLNHFRDEIPEIKTLRDILDMNVFKSDLSVENVKFLVENNLEKQIVIFFDAFDEMSKENKKRILEVIAKLQKTKSNVRIVISGRKDVREKLEKQFKVTAMELKPFSRDDQINYFEKFWKIDAKDKQRFKEFAQKILEQLEVNFSHQERAFIGIPLMTFIVAHIYAVPVRQFLNSNKAAETFIADDTLNILDLYKEFFKIIIKVMMNKKYNANENFQPDYVFNPTMEDIYFVYQVVAVQNYLPDTNNFISLIGDKKFYDTLQKFNFRPQDYQSVVLECKANGSSFTHLSFRDYLAANMVFKACCQMEETFLGNYEYDYNDRKSFFYFLLMMANRAEDTSVIKCIAKFDNSPCNQTIIEVCCQGDFLKNIKNIHEMQKDGPSIFNNCRYLEKYKEEDCRAPCLQITAEYGSKQVDEYLIELLKQEKYCKYPLHTFVQSDRVDLVEQYLTDANNNSHINLKDRHDSKPLVLAKSVKMIKLLIAKGAELDKSDFETGDNNHEFISKIKIEELDEILLIAHETGNQISNYCDAVLEGVILYDYANVMQREKVKLLIEKGANKNTALEIAAEEENLDIVQYLIVEWNAQKSETFNNYGIADYLHNVTDSEAITHAITTCIQLGIEDKEENALHYVVEADVLEATKLLIGEGTNVIAHLRKAIEHESYKVAEFLLTQDVDLSLTDGDKNTVLHLAAGKGKTEFVAMVIDKYLKSILSLDKKNEAGETALWIAAANRNDSIVQLLLESRAKSNIYPKLMNWTTVNYLNERFGVPLPQNKLSDLERDNLLDRIKLYEAVQNGYKQKVQLLIEAGTDVNIKNSNGQIPLHLALNKKIFDLLVSFGANVNARDNDGNTGLHIAASNQNIEMVQCFIESSPDIINEKNKYGKTPLHLAIDTNYGYAMASKTIKLLVESNAKILCKDNYGKSCLFYALEKWSYDFEPSLIQIIEKSNSLECGELLFQYLNIKYYRVNVTVCNVLIQKIEDINISDKNGRTFLHIAAHNNRFGAVKILIEKGADVDAKDNSGNIPLHYACNCKTENLSSEFNIKGPCNVAGYLAVFSANVNHKNKDGKTPLHLAIENKDTYSEFATTLLIYKNASINVSDNEMNSYLHLAIRHKKWQVAEILIDRFDPSDLNKQNKKGETALHVAVENEFFKFDDNEYRYNIVKKIVEKGVDLLPIKTKEGKTASYLAGEKNHTTIFNFLKTREEELDPSSESNSETGSESNQETNSDADSQTNMVTDSEVSEDG